MDGNSGIEIGGLTGSTVDVGMQNNGTVMIHESISGAGRWTAITNHGVSITKGTYVVNTNGLQEVTSDKNLEMTFNHEVETALDISNIERIQYGTDGSINIRYTYGGTKHHVTIPAALSDLVRE